MLMIKTKKILWVISIGLFIANGHGAARRTEGLRPRIRELFVTTRSPGVAASSSWSLRNPERKSLHEILSEQRQSLFATPDAMDPLLNKAFEGVEKITDPIALNTDQLRIFFTDWGTARASYTKRLACTVLNLVVEQASLTVLDISEELVHDIFLNLKTLRIIGRWNWRRK